MRLLLVVMLMLAGCGKREKSFVVLYTSQDQFYAEPILSEFSERSGIEVRPVFDTESAKTAALAHRLRAEAGNPQCDVFWSNEEMHMRLLVRDGVVPEDEWRGAGSRTRRMVVNTNLVAPDRFPGSLLELTNSSWKGRVAIAYPLFGTTQSHFLALRQIWGEEVWKQWCEGLVRNEAKVVDGNSVVVRLVGSGECLIGLTDSDDVAAGLRQELPVAALETSSEMIAIPSTIGLVRDAPRAAAARVLIEYLSRASTLGELVSVGALENVEATPPDATLFEVSWREALQHAEEVNRFLQLTFVRS